MAALSGRSPFHKLSYLRRRFEEVSVSGVKNIYIQEAQLRQFNPYKIIVIQQRKI
jgi:hypothetical protein